MGQSRYRILYFQGSELDLSTKMLSGRALLDGTSLSIEGPSRFVIPISKITEPRLFRQHGLGRMIRFGYDGRNYYVTVVRINFFGYFAIINFFATGKLFQDLKP